MKASTTRTVAQPRLLVPLVVGLLAVLAILGGGASASAVTTAAATPVTVTGPSSIAVGTTSVIHYYVTGVAEPSVTVQWQLTGPVGCYNANGGGLSRADGTFAFQGTITPRTDLTSNSCASTYELVVSAFGSTPTDAARTVSIQRAAKWVGVDASPEPVKSGQVVTTVGTIERADWVTHTYRGFASTVAQLQFKSTSGTTWRTYASGSSSTGRLVGQVHQRVSGCWRDVFLGSSTTTAAVSPADCVAVS